MTMTERPVLQATGISKFFPGAIALDEVDLILYPGEVHALLGENGAGKSTLIKCLTGAHRRDGGAIMLDGKDIDPRGPLESQACGIGAVYQEVNLLPNLTVAENLCLGRAPTRFGFVSRREMNRLAAAMLAEFQLEIDPARLLSTYPIAIRQVVAIARAVDLSGKVLILDEPTASLDRDEVALLFRVIRTLTARGLAVVFISHFFDQVFAIADRATILRNGRAVGCVTLADTTQTEVVTLMLGRNLQAAEARRAPAEIGAPILSLRGFGRRGAIAPFDLDLHEGEVIGLAGLLGSGRTETAEAIFGAAPADQGAAHLRGAPARLSAPRDAIARGIGYCPEDRKTHGIVGDLSVRENIILSLQARQGWLRALPRAKIDAIADAYVRALDIRLANLDMPIRLLSGGNQQKALLARWLATEPDILILDEPTRGIDVGAHAEIIALIEGLRADGMALIVASSELDELVACASRVIVLRDRLQCAVLSGDAISTEAIVRAIADDVAPQVAA